MCWKLSHSVVAAGDFYPPWRHLEITFLSENFRRIENLLRQLDVERTEQFYLSANVDGRSTLAHSELVINELTSEKLALWICDDDWAAREGKFQFQFFHFDRSQHQH